MKTFLNKEYCFIFLVFLLLMGVLLRVPASAQEEAQPLGQFQYFVRSTDSDQPTLIIDPLQEKVLSVGAGSLNLSLFDAIKYALEGNRNIEISAYYPKQAEQDFKRYKAVYDPVAFATYTISQTDRPIQSQLDTGSIFDDALVEDRWMARVGVKSLFSSGATISLFQEFDYLESSSSLISPNPQSTSRVTAQLQQPLLKGVGDQVNRTAIKTARLNIKILNEDFRQTVTDVIANVALIYWQLVSDQKMINIGNRYLVVTRELLRRERNRLGSGLAKELDVKRVLANLDSRMSELILLDKQARATKKRLMLLLNAPDLFSADRQLALILSDRSLLEFASLDRVQAETDALKNRPELERARKELQAAELRKALNKWERLPTLNLQASYTKNALGSKQWSNWDNVYNSDKDSWMVGVNFEMPIGNRSAKAQYLSADLNYRRMLSELRLAEDTVLFEVNQALTDLELTAAEVEAAERAKITAVKVVDGEKALFELARSDSSDLLQAQSQLDVTERKLAQSQIELNRAKIVLSRAKGTLLEDLGVSVQ